MCIPEGLPENLLSVLGGVLEKYLGPGYRYHSVLLVGDGTYDEQQMVSVSPESVEEALETAGGIVSGTRFDWRTRRGLYRQDRRIRVRLHKSTIVRCVFQQKDSDTWKIVVIIGEGCAGRLLNPCIESVMHLNDVTPSHIEFGLQCQSIR